MVSSAFHVNYTKCFNSLQENGNIVLMLDGTFCCAHKRSSGESYEVSKDGNRLFLDEEYVQSFISDSSDEVKDIGMVSILVFKRFYKIISIAMCKFINTYHASTSNQETCKHFFITFIEGSVHNVRVATSLENLENSGNLKNCQNLGENTGTFELL